MLATLDPLELKVTKVILEPLDDLVLKDHLSTTTEPLEPLEIPEMMELLVPKVTKEELVTPVPLAVKVLMVLARTVTLVCLVPKEKLVAMVTMVLQEPKEKLDDRVYLESLLLD